MKDYLVAYLCKDGVIRGMWQKGTNYDDARNKVRQTLRVNNPNFRCIYTSPVALIRKEIDNEFPGDNKTNE